MSQETNEQKYLPLIVPTLIGILLIIIGFVGFYTSNNTNDTLMSLFFIIPGIFFLFISFTRFKEKQHKIKIIKHDERTEMNRVKSADWGFRFYFVSFSALIVLNTFRIIDEVTFVALTGPIIAIGILIYYIINIYYYERRG